jgi:lipopolysaccharide biosynthesis glycosyltransferase
MINIYYCTDDKLFKQLVLSLLSLTQTTKEPLNVINLTQEIPEYSAKVKKTSPAQDALCNKILREVNPQSTFRSIDISDLFREHLLHTPNSNNRYYKIYVAARLLAHLVPEIPDKILYVDSDVLFPKDIKELWDIDVSNFEMAGRPDLFLATGRGRLAKYIQSGVMLFNMKKIRENGTFDRALNLIKTKKYTCYIDMSALNTACKGKNKLLLPKKYNSYTWTKNAVVHHVCALRRGHIPFSRAWLDRMKPDRDEARPRLPMYAAIYKKLDDAVGT